MILFYKPRQIGHGISDICYDIITTCGVISFRLTLYQLIDTFIIIKFSKIKKNPRLTPNSQPVQMESPSLHSYLNCSRVQKKRPVLFGALNSISFKALQNNTYSKFLNNTALNRSIITPPPRNLRYLVLDRVDRAKRSK